MVCFHWVCVLLTLTFTCTTATYKDFKLIDLNLDEKQKSNINHVLNQLVEDYGVDRLSEKKIRIEPQYYNDVTEILNMEGISFELVSEDVEKFLKKTGYANSTEKNKNRKKRFFNKNHLTCLGYTEEDLFSDRSTETLENIIYKKENLHYCQIETWLKEMEKRHSDVLTLDEMGKSHEGRSMLVAKINNGLHRDVVVVEGGMVPKSWVSITTALSFIQMLVRALKGNTCVFNRYAFHVIPVMNPDGYQYTLDTDRLWAKTMAFRGFMDNHTECKGADMTRNFNFHFNQCRKEPYTGPVTTIHPFVAEIMAGKQRIPNPCRSPYPGDSVESEIETQNVVRYFSALKGRVKLSFTLGSYSNIWLLPYSNSQLHNAPNYKNMFEVATTAKEAVYHNHLITFRLGTIRELLLYKQCGSFMDWMAEKLNVPYAYTLKLLPLTSNYVMTVDLIEKYGKIFSTAIENVLTEIRKIEYPNEHRDRTIIHITKHDGFVTKTIHMNATACRNILLRQSSHHDHTGTSNAYHVHVVNRDDSWG